MSRFQMIVLDLDGTLLSPAGEVTPRVKGAIRRALDAGLLVCFATGRNWTESREILDALDHYPTAVFVGGAMVMDTHHEVTLHRTMMEPSLAGEVCDQLEKAGHAALALQDKGTAGVDYLVSGKSLNAATRAWMAVTKATLHQVESLAKYPHEHTIRLGICAEPGEVQLIKRQLEERFGSRVFCQNLMVPAYGVEVLEVFDPAVNKWEGVLHIARRHGIDPQRIVAIGDDVNDLPMIRNAGLGVAMGNARPEVKAVAGRVIGANHDEGLADFLDELVDRHEVDPLNENERTQIERTS
ncbi:MAG TPA: HAD family hydrolase [Tepidisphaeraceae bacterium]|nr:HAD family hydrolase [Tepidisphaeraceae bacterium]